jgi:Uma2 family endonuclease
MAVAVSRRRFTADEYQRMGQVGILSREDRVELIDGEIVAKMTIGPRHAACVDRATRAFVTTARDAAIVRVQGSVRLDFFTEPEPDLVLLRPRADYYASAHPGPSDILLIIEVAESSIDYDREIKTGVYARKGVREYWVVDLNENVIWCYTDPDRGAYQRLRRCESGDSVAPGLLPEVMVSTADLLGP